MKLFKRMLAMLAVIAITVSGFAFAEEPAPVIEIEEIAIEETAAEESAVETEDIPEEAEEAIPAEAAEESEPVEAEAIEEEMPETIDVPVVYSYFHRDEVPGDCPHTHAYLTSDARWDKQVLNQDAQNHTLRYTGEEYFYCPDCGYDYYLPINGYKETTEPHSWSENQCWECGYINPCTHENRELGYVSKWDITVLSTEALSHTVSCRAQNRFDCPDCGQMIWEELEGYQIISEAHDWNENGDGSSYCWICKYVNTCTHEGKNIEHEGYADQTVVSMDAKNHTIRFRSEILFECLACGYRGWEISEESQTVTEPHDWYEGKCWVCEATNSCPHLNAFADPYPGRINLQTVGSTASGHTVSYQEVTYYECPDCYESYREVSPETITVTEPHNWHNGFCDFCETANPCTHPNLITEGSDRISQSLISYDEKQHSCVFVDRTWYYCPDCEENMWEDSTETYTATEAHRWWNGECEYCPAVNPCPHLNRYEDYVSTMVRKVLSFTATEHTIEYQEETLFICPDCGDESWELDPEIRTKTEAHDWNEGECWVCEAINNCRHADKVEEGTYWNIVNVLSTTALKHTAEVRDVTFYSCRDCGERIYEEAASTYTLTAAHEWNEHGTCYECNYRTICTHPNAVVNSSYDYYGQGKKVDARTHSMNYFLLEYTSCPDCGFRSETSRTVENRLENHSFDEKGFCWICDYKVVCAHKNTVTEDGRFYKDCKKKDSESHTIRFTTLRIEICEDCGAEVSRKETGTESLTEPHYLNYANLCVDCGYESSCSHSKKEAKSDWNEYAQSFDLNNHIIIRQEYTFYICQRCNCELINHSINKVTGTKLEKHAFKNGQCIECGLYEVECIHDFGKDGKCKLCGKEQKVELEAIILPKSIMIYVGEDFQLEASLSPSNASAELKYSSSNTKVASVSGNGLISPKKVGETTITVKSGDVKASCTVIVAKRIEKISLNRSELTLRLNAGYQLTAAIEPADADKDLLWTSSNFSAVSVDQDGFITANAYGSAVITVASNANPEIKASCTVTVSDTVPEIELGVSELILAEKQSYQLEPVMVPENAGAAFSYACSNSKVAGVTKSGKITAKKAGSATITVTSTTGEEARLELTVMKAPSKVSISNTKMTVGAGESFQLTAGIAENCYTTGYSWTSSNSKVATVDENGFVTTLNAGKANITVKVHNGKSAKCAVTVMAFPDSISLSADALTMGVGQSSALSVSLPKNTAAQIVWSVSGDAVTVENGSITAVKPGSATVTASSANGLVSASCAVNVKPAPEKVVVEDITVVAGQKFNVSAKLQAGDESYEGAYSAKLSSGSSVLSVDKKTGMFSAKKAGTAYVTVTAYNGVSAECIVTVYAAPKSVKLSASKKTLEVGESFELTAKPNPIDAYTEGFTVSMDKEGIVSVDGEDGVFTVTAEAKGKVKITIAASNGKKAVCTVTVK